MYDKIKELHLTYLLKYSNLINRTRRLMNSCTYSPDVHTRHQKSLGMFYKLVKITEQNDKSTSSK